MNKKQRRTEQLERHYNTLSQLAEYYSGSLTDGKKLSLRLLKLENAAHKITTDQCNGDGNQAEQEQELTAIMEQVKKLFPYIQHLFINGDARGYAIKLKEVEARKLRDAGINIHNDWGGYGILSPEITGD